MAEDGGYEVIGPTGGPPQPSIPQFPTASAPGPPAPGPPAPSTPAKPPASVPPPARNAVPKSAPDSQVGSAYEKDKKTSMGGDSKMSKMIKGNASVAESVMENADGEGKAAFQRPNGCDVTQLAFVFFLMIIVIAVTIPVLMAATGKAKISFITGKLSKL